MEGVEQMTHRDFINSFLNYQAESSVEEKLCATLGLDPSGEEISRLRWSGLFSSDAVGLSEGTPAQILEHILNKKWKLAPGDKDFIVMWHRFGFHINEHMRSITSHLTIAGENESQTAMSKTVGLPLGIATKLLLTEKIKQRGVVIPIEKEMYDPILAELNTLGIHVAENEN
jgi:saccharopine dehydrogenase (NADP+, L-glutamate forming)